jgi:hypothetical protein
MGLAWAKAAGQAYVPLQFPSLIAGAVGLAMVGLATGAAAVQLGRRDDAVARAEVDRLVGEATGAASALARRYVGND